MRFCRAPGCTHRVIVRKGQRNVGRGYGMREGNKARGAMIEHLRTCEFVRAALAR